MLSLRPRYESGRSFGLGMLHPIRYSAFVAATLVVVLLLDGS
jgi:hypothetical protein